MRDNFRDFGAISFRARALYVLRFACLFFAIRLALDLIDGDDLDWGGYLITSLGSAFGAVLAVLVFQRRR